jgi:hypothetical protein
MLMLRRFQTRIDSVFEINNSYAGRRKLTATQSTAYTTAQISVTPPLPAYLRAGYYFSIICPRYVRATVIGLEIETCFSDPVNVAIAVILLIFSSKNVDAS